jgi:hypothetical protein
MNPLTGMMMIFLLILLTFFGLPIAVVLLLNVFFPANFEPVSKPLAIDPTFKVIHNPLGVPINVMKVENKGNIIWVDAPNTVDVVNVVGA